MYSYNIHEIEHIVIQDSISVSQYIVNSIDFMFFILVPIQIKDDDFPESHWKLKLYQSNLFLYWYFFEIPFILNLHIFKISVIKFVPIALLLAFPIHFISATYLSLKFKHCLINLIGVIISLLILSDFTVQILRVLKNFGLIWSINEFILGLLIFSISNSMNDLVTNLTISKINPILAINSCLGSPILIILLGIGINGCILISQFHNHDAIKFNLNINVTISMLSLIITVAFYILYIPLNNWVLDRRAGIGLILFYLIITGVICSI
ncbi:Sodium/calcium exchanger protein-domain-containing protein [Scheffersomyces amazonensis]|uniref:Sodium/calcium exchanger protein-domain-containing protein n=1 Tax=Scheffersomyces amazonensis TaxID=1078765 RepID=UPI00315DB4FB